MNCQGGTVNPARPFWKQRAGSCRKKQEPLILQSSRYASTLLKGKTRVNPNAEEETYGMLYVADVFSLGEIHSEIEKIMVTEHLVDHWTYPLIQPKLIAEAQRRGY